MPNNPLEKRPSLSITRHYNASPEEVWRAWTDPEAMRQWWRPDDTFSTPVIEADVRVGGRFRVLMISAEGKEHDVSGVYLEVIPNEKLMFTWTWKEKLERESLVTVTLRPSSGGTELELKHEQFFDAEERDSHQEGWMGSLAQLERFLA
jgi:uncharacterized protein YndB with AHSA1/START domain